MTNEEMLNDLKQYIDVKNDALGSRLKTEIVGELKGYIHEVISESTETILDAMGTRVETIENKMVIHETRITKLEAKIA